MIVSQMVEETEMEAEDEFYDAMENVKHNFIRS